MDHLLNNFWTSFWIIKVWINESRINEVLLYVHMYCAYICIIRLCISLLLHVGMCKCVCMDVYSIIGMT